MAESNGHEGISHPFGEKHGTATKSKRDLADRMYPHFHDELARGSASYATQLWTARHKEAVRVVKADLGDLMLPHDEKYHKGWEPYTPEPKAPIPYCSVGARSLDLGIFTPPRLKALNLSHSEHQQIICSDGENFGLTGDKDNNDTLVEKSNKLHEYIVSPIKYRKDIVIQARDDLSNEWIKYSNDRTRYSVGNNNCQHYIEDVFKRAAEIAREKQVKLVLD